MFTQLTEFVMWFYLVMGDVVRRVLWKQWLIWQE